MNVRFRLSFFFFFVQFLKLGLDDKHLRHSGPQHSFCFFFVGWFVLIWNCTTNFKLEICTSCTWPCDFLFFYFYRRVVPSAICISFLFHPINQTCCTHESSQCLCLLWTGVLLQLSFNLWPCASLDPQGFSMQQNLFFLTVFHMIWDQAICGSWKCFLFLPYCYILIWVSSRVYVLLAPIVQGKTPGPKWHSPK